MQMFGKEKDQCLYNSLLNLCVDCEQEVVGQKWRDAERGDKKENRQPETQSDCHSRFHKPWRVHTEACTHQYAVTKASQIGNSFSQFRFNHHRGNVNVSEVPGASLYSLPATICVLHDGTGDGWHAVWQNEVWREAEALQGPTENRYWNKKRKESQPPFSSSSTLEAGLAHDASRLTSASQWAAVLTRLWNVLLC